MKNRPTDELLRTFGGILAELRRRGICRSENLPTGDLAEFLACKTLGLTLAPKSAKGFDATDSAGLRYQIKGRRITPRNSSRQLSAIRELADSPFDFVVAILFDQEFRVIAAYRFTWAGCRDAARFIVRTNSHKIFANELLIGRADSQDLTIRIQRALETA